MYSHPYLSYTLKLFAEAAVFYTVDQKQRYVPYVHIGKTALLFLAQVLKVGWTEA